MAGARASTLMQTCNEAMAYGNSLRLWSEPGAGMKCDRHREVMMDQFYELTEMVRNHFAIGG
jgi:hypothetical protein